MFRNSKLLNVLKKEQSLLFRLYHCGIFLAFAQGSLTVTLPAYWKGKNFKAIPSVALTYSSIPYPMSYNGVSVASYNIANGTFTVQGFYGDYDSGHAGGHLDISYIVVGG